MEEATSDGAVAAVIVLFDGVTELTVGRIVGVPIDLTLVGVIARLQLLAGRQGRTVRLRNPCMALQELLRFVGLAHLIEAAPPARSRPQPRYGGSPNEANSSG